MPQLLGLLGPLSAFRNVEVLGVEVLADGGQQLLSLGIGDFARGDLLPAEALNVVQHHPQLYALGFLGFERVPNRGVEEPAEVLGADHS